MFYFKPNYLRLVLFTRLHINSKKKDLICYQQCYRTSFFLLLSLYSFHIHLLNILLSTKSRRRSFSEENNLLKFVTTPLMFTLGLSVVKVTSQSRLSTFPVSQICGQTVMYRRIFGTPLERLCFISYSLSSRSKLLS